VDVPESLTPTPGPFYRKRAALILLRNNADFRLLFVAEIVSFCGDWFLFVALAGLVYDLTHSAALVTALYATLTVPFAMVAFIGGALADRYNRQILMISADTIRGVLALGFFFIHTASQVWVLFLLFGSISALGAVFGPAASAAIPNLVSREDLAAANVLGAATWGTMLAVGAAIGGLVVVAFGRGAGYVGDAVSFFLSAVLVLRIRGRFAEPRVGEDRHPGLVEATKETLAYARKDRRVLALLAVKGGFGMGAGAIALLPVLALTVYHAGDRGTGILYAFRGAGIVIGPFLVRPFIREDDLRTVFWGIAFAFVIFGSSYAVVAWMPVIWLAGAFVLVGHLGGGVQWTLSSYALQLIVPDRIRGRIFAFDEALISLTIAASATLAGWIADSVDVRLVMVGLAGVTLVFAAAWTLATRSVRRSLRPERAAPVASGEPEAPAQPGSHWSRPS
jgi:MFS family permease